ncbi:hypothetical protein DPMN_029619 [Dreissena polymorpha]|uniref:ShKT domain-containing protein n=1 Tax=Dreissena polymorpha TaxID=45954 RepID=A0A9D4LWS7_DREPO|nr:hypothetical protein DPMN_029619 [Dreissena polymorpha]
MRRASWPATNVALPPLCNKALCNHPWPATCTDDQSVDCAKIHSLFNMCADIQKAKLVCPKLCNICNSTEAGAFGHHGDRAQSRAMSACRGVTGHVLNHILQKVETIAMEIPEMIRFAMSLDAQMLGGRHGKAGVLVQPHAVKD